MKHTPGPWDYSWQIQPNGCPTVGHKGLMVCMVAHSVKDPTQKETALANANLIAAAPDLLAALEPFARFNSSEETLRIEVSSADVARARAAIAAATGAA